MYVVNPRIMNKDVSLNSLYQCTPQSLLGASMCVSTSLGTLKTSVLRRGFSLTLDSHSAHAETLGLSQVSDGFFIVLQMHIVFKTLGNMSKLLRHSSAHYKHTSSLSFPLRFQLSHMPVSTSISDAERSC